MRPAFILLSAFSASLFSVGCNSPATMSMVTANGTQITVSSSARVGGRGGIAGNIPGGGRFAIFDNNDASFREVASVARTGLWLGAAKAISGDISEGLTSVATTKSSNALKAAESANAVKIKQIEADLAAKQIESATAVPPAP